MVESTLNSTKLRDLSVSEKKEQLVKLLRERLKLRLDKATGNTIKAHRFKQVRRNIARLLYLLHQEDKQEESRGQPCV